jgi:segregation and condensation protein A
MDLVRALEAMAERNNKQLPPPTNNFQGIVGKEPYPVGRKTGELLRRLLLRGVEKLKNLFQGNKSRSEIVATFLAVLEMCKTGSAYLEGDVSGENPDVRIAQKKEGGEPDGTN